MFIVSACLAGVKCKYNGEDNLKPDILELFTDKKAILVCPEQLGGLATPRQPAEIWQGSGEDVLVDKAKIITKDGTIITPAFLKGAKETLRLAKLLAIKKAILKEGSPSCGTSFIYDGTFQGSKKPGQGVTTALLRKAGFEVISENDF